MNKGPALNHLYRHLVHQYTFHHFSSPLPVLSTTECVPQFVVSEGGEDLGQGLDSGESLWLGIALLGLGFPVEYEPSLA